MGDKEEGSTAKKFDSPSVDVIDLTQDDDDDPEATTKGGKKPSGSRETNGGHIKMGFPRGWKPQSSMSSAVKYSQKQPIAIDLTNSDDTLEDSARRTIFYRKRKLCKGRCAACIKRAMEKGLLRNGSAGIKIGVGPSAAHKKFGGHDAKTTKLFGLNHPCLDEGKEGSKKVIGNEDSTTQALRRLDLNKQLTINDLDPLPEKKQKSRTGEEVDSSVVDKHNDAAAGDDAKKVSEIDLNKVPTEVDKNWY